MIAGGVCTAVDAIMSAMLELRPVDVVAGVLAVPIERIADDG